MEKRLRPLPAEVKGGERPALEQHLDAIGLRLERDLPRRGDRGADDRTQGAGQSRKQESHSALQRNGGADERKRPNRLLVHSSVRPLFHSPFSLPPTQRAPSSPSVSSSRRGGYQQAAAPQRPQRGVPTMDREKLIE